MCCLVHPSYFAKKESTTTRKAAVDQSAGAIERPVKTIETFGTQTEKGKVVWIYRNGDKHDKGTRYVIHKTKFKNLAQVCTDMTTKVGIFTGAVRKIYRPDGTTLQALEDFIDNHEYICAGAEALQRDQSKFFWTTYEHLELMYQLMILVSPHLYDHQQKRLNPPAE